ncbi:MAG TPA: hypothetical protein VHG08_17820 [Longimicrobium sp.]|nr:hypothetical protein [Longimicrobium sp.]
MKKLMLAVEDLIVESFDTSPAARPRGTVVGQQCTCYTVCTCPGCPTCDGTCPEDPSCADTCWDTCDGRTCWESCGPSGCDTCDYSCRCRTSEC